MTGAIKMEGFQPSNGNLSSSPSSRPVLSRPFSDGSMTVESSILSSLMNAAQPFSFGAGMPSGAGGEQGGSNNNPGPGQQQFDYNMVSPHSGVVDLPPSGASPHSFQPQAMFAHLNFGAENREPPVVTSPVENNNNKGRSRSQSSSRSSNVGKAPTGRARSGRKLSMNDVKPNIQPTRGRTMPMQPPRSMSFHTDSKPPSSSVLPYAQPPRANSITSADYFNEYGIAIPRNDFGRGMWAGGSAPSVLPDPMASYGTSVDAAEVLQSPFTPAQNITLMGDESRKQRRRECHNQVEKRRREHINSMIEELNKLLPARFKMPPPDDIAVEDDDDAEEQPSDSPVKKKKTKRTASTSKQQKDAVQCKGRILSDSVKYIRDLQTVNEQQSTRIRYLEDLLMAGGSGSSAAQSGAWPPSQAASAQSSSDPLPFPSDQLEAMRASPEADSIVPLQPSGWNGFGSSNNMLVFEPSPTDASSGPDQHRSTPLSSGSPETDNKDPVVWGLAMDFNEEPRADPASRIRKDSQHELQSSLSAMELDVDGPRQWPNF